MARKRNSWFENSLDPVTRKKNHLTRSVEIESLELRVMLTFPPVPIIPSVGEQHQLVQALKHADKGNFNALDNFPVPAAVVASANGAVPTVANWKAGNGMLRIDADRSKATGPGGNDIEVGIQTELFPTPHLSMTINRLGNAAFASDLEVLISFPFDAFNTEILPGDPNVFIGYHTTLSDQAVGGHAPLSETIEFFPNIMAGDDHEVELNFTTIGADNPIRLITGFFDGTNLTGILDAAAYTAWLETPPQDVSIGLDVENSALFGSATEMSVGFTWDASTATKVVFDYLEEESGALGDADYNTTITVDPMPIHEELFLSLDENLGEVTVSHRGSSPIEQLEILSERSDGLTIRATATDVPTEVDLSLDLVGSATLDVNANTLDLQLEVIKEGGFLNTSDFLGYDVGYASVLLENAPDLSIGFLPGTDSVGVAATNPGESIGAVALIIGDDENLELPPFQSELGFAPWDDPDPRHVFSLIDDGTHGTAAARFVHVQEASFDLDPASISEVFTLITTEAAPLTAYLRTTEDSNLIANHDVEVTMNVHDFPAGNITFNMNPPDSLSYSIDPPQGIDSIHIFGHIDNNYFDIIAANLPADFSYAFDPDGSLSVTADDGDGIPEPASPGDQIGLLGAILSNGVDTDGLSGTIKDLFGQPVRNARFRVDAIPSFDATWSDNSGATNIAFDTVAPNAYLGGAQVEVSTVVVPFTHFDAPLAGTGHYLRFRDDGDSNEKRLGAGAFGIDRFTYDSSDTNATYGVSYRSNSARPLAVTFDSEFGGKFFPQFNSDLGFNITNVPQSFDFTADLDPGFHYTGSGSVSSITLVGTVDDTDDAVANGTDIDFSFSNLPSLVRFSLEMGTIGVIDGLLDMNGDTAVDGSDDGVAGGVLVIDGKLDTNFDGGIDAGDDDTFLGANVIDGGLDINLDSTVDGNDDGGLNGFELKMNGGVDSVSLSLSSENVIFGSPYQLFEAAITSIPAHTLATWVGERILVETKDAVGAPQPLGQVMALISTDNDASDITTKLLPFSTTGPGGARVNYSPFLQEIDNRYLTAGGSTSVIPRLAELYNDGEVFDPGEDHLIGHVQGGTLDVASLQFTGFQKLLVDPGLNGGTYEFRKPVAGVSPFFLGAGLDATIATIQLDNIPDLIQINTNIAGKDITWHTEDDVFDSIGDVDVYVGPAVMAQDADMAGRFVMKDVPSDVHIFWDFGFPNGNANFDANDEFELLFLAQNGSKRLVGGLQLEDLQVGYTVGIDVFFDVDWFGPVPTELALNILSASAGIDNDVDGPEIGANISKPGVDGFFGLYSMTGSPAPLVNPAGPAPGGSEYTPDITFLMKDFREFSLTLDVGVELIPVFLSPEVELTSNLVGDFVLDFWAGEIDVTAEAFIEFGFFNAPDYTDNTPIHLVPLGGPDFDHLFDAVYTFVGFHDFDEHFDPFV